VSYPFGYGLSYTSFSYENPRIKEDKDKYVITVTVKNTGKYSGKEVVQLYASAPDRVNANKPEKELKAFMKTKNLRPGESATVVLIVGTSELASFDEQSSSWIVTPGVYQFQIASSSRDIKMVLDANVTSNSAKATDILKLKEPIDLLKR
jgi:beta-glucosidase